MADRNKKTIYVGGLPAAADENLLLSTFSVFGDVLEVQIPKEGGAHAGSNARNRGFGFVVFSTTEEAEDAIDNMHLNELGGKIIHVNLAKPLKALIGTNKPVWQDEEWIKQYAKPLAGDGPAIDTAADTAAAGEEQA
ncbi:RNA-binding domain-containing protein [Tilletiaria anomala UBC 951]|uniref:RNA-binding domain-containing protein n=1 Tax=Tilletiaria anomala (strain ATCC 24038 / CBS 436.72 / UBC 951) TaxID=1037660 RepID=A0A066WQC7_TILAU|nr:RNA-binding domain-containing protein [Tilletiaria anomala UBC 951]KDN52825.1 RNA-binding domain-containing protein [Tilletiaria anomala UBC 951]